VALGWYWRPGCLTGELQGGGRRFAPGARWARDLAALAGCPQGVLIRSARLAAQSAEADVAELTARGVR